MEKEVKNDFENKSKSKFICIEEEETYGGKIPILPFVLLMLAILLGSGK